MIFEPFHKSTRQLAHWIAAPPYAGVPWVVLAYILAACCIYIQNGPFTGHLVGFDDHTRMVQVLNLVNGTGWYNHVIARADPPEGFETIWARIVDIPIALIILIGEIFVDQKTAAIAASVIGPVSEIILLFYVARYAARPLVGKDDAWLVVLFLLFTSLFNQRRFTFAGFHLGEASHHSWYVILNVLLIGAAARLVVGVKGKTPFLFVSLAMGLFLAVGIEGFPLMAGTAALFGLLAWGFQDPKLALRGAKAIGGGAALGLLLLPLHQPPSRLFDVSFSQPSIMGPVLVGAAGLFLFIEYVILVGFARYKVLSLIGMAVVGMLLAAVLVTSFPQILDGPGAALSPTERQLAAREHPESWAMYRAVGNLVEYAGLLMPTIIAVTAGFAASRTTRSVRRKKMFLTYTGFAFLDGLMAQIFWRYIHHAMTSSCLLLLYTWSFIRRTLPDNLNYSLWSFLAFIGLGPLWMIIVPGINYNVPFVSQVLLFPAKIYVVDSPWDTCDMVDISAYLDAHYPPSTRLNVPDWDSANFLFHTNLMIDFLANYPSHDRFVDNKLFFETQDVEQSRLVALRHNFDLVAACALLPISTETARSRPFREPMMVERLKEGDVPDWLTPVNTGLATNYRLYKVNKDRLNLKPSKN